MIYNIKFLQSVLIFSSKILNPVVSELFLWAAGFLKHASIIPLSQNDIGFNIHNMVTLISYLLMCITFKVCRKY